MGWQHAIAGGQGNLIAIVFKSPDYVPGVSGWAVFRDGSVEFNNGVFRGTVTAGEFDGTDFVINSAGAFFYNGAPAAGNLFNAIAPAAGTDSHGNAYLAGDWSYPVPGVTPNEFAGAWRGELRFGNGATLADMGTLAAVDTGTVSLTSPVLSGTDTPAALSLVSHDKTGLGYAVVQVATLNPTWLAATNPNNGNPEVWHTPVLQNNWAASSVFKFKLTPFAETWLQGNLDPAAVTGGFPSTVTTLPPAYRPATTLDFGIGEHTNAPLGTQGAFIRVSTTGTVQVLNGATTMGVIIVGIRVPLDY